MQNNSQRHNDKQTQEDFFTNICTSHFIVRVRKGLLKVCVWEGVGDEQKLQYFDRHSYGRQRCVFLVLQGCSTGGPEVHSTEWWLSLLHLISNFSAPQLNRGPRAPSAWCGFPYHISSITPSPTGTHQGPQGPFGLMWLYLKHLVWSLTATATATLTSVLTELYNSSSPTQSPTRSLEWHDWSSSSGNNCHVVHRSLTFGASVYECTTGIFFTSSHFISQFPPTRFSLITAIRMCHFLPVYHSEWHFWPGRRSKYHNLVWVGFMAYQPFLVI